MNNNKKDSNENFSLPEIQLPYNNNSLFFNLIGVANVFLNILAYGENAADDARLLTGTTLEHSVRILSQQGEINGRLRVKLEIVSIKKLMPTNEHESVAYSKARAIKYRLHVIDARDLPIQYCNLVFCQYKFWFQSQPIVVRSLDDEDDDQQHTDGHIQTSGENKQAIVNFNHVTEFEVQTNEDFDEYCSDGALAIEVYSQRRKVGRNEEAS